MINSDVKETSGSISSSPQTQTRYRDESKPNSSKQTNKRNGSAIL